MKNQRDVCLARDAGYLEYEELPGKIKTGCMHSPGYKSHYCTLHSPTICQVPSDDDAEGKGETTDVIASILDTKTTRSTKYYKAYIMLLMHVDYFNDCLQVMWLGKDDASTSWVQKDKVPQKVIDDYESGAKM